MSMKYVCARGEDGNEEIFVFPASVHHDAFAEALMRMRNKTSGDWKRPRREIVSAGFVGADFKCSGHSETLNLYSREQDSALLAQQLGPTEQT